MRTLAGRRRKLFGPAQLKYKGKSILNGFDRTACPTDSPARQHPMRRAASIPREGAVWHRTCPSTRYRRDDCEGRSSSLAMAAAHALWHCGLANIDPELEQFAMNPWRPQRGLAAGKCPRGSLAGRPDVVSSSANTLGAMPTGRRSSWLLEASPYAPKDLPSSLMPHGAFAPLDTLRRKALS
jgi:hypothetical protein